MQRLLSRRSVARHFVARKSGAWLYFRHHFKSPPIGFNRAPVEPLPAQNEVRWITNTRTDLQQKIPAPLKSPARWGSTDGAGQSKSNARLECGARRMYPLRT
jgi:hypothetical protein